MSKEINSTKKERYHIDLVGGGGGVSRSTKGLKGGKRNRKLTTAAPRPGRKP